MARYIPLLSLAILFACGQPKQESVAAKASPQPTGIRLIILGTIQDAGSPHIACQKACCRYLFAQPDDTRQVVSLGLVDSDGGQTYLFEATPDISRQCKALKQLSRQTEKELPDGILLTHAHIGHYTGLMYLGKEACSAQKVPVYAMPRMQTYLESNGPWSQLVRDSNVFLKPLQKNTPVQLNKNIRVTPLQVPHRDEYSETVGYLIKGPEKTALFIPDIDKWEKWGQDILQLIREVDYAFIDGTFYSGAELNHRDISQIPHPFVIESMRAFEHLSPAEKNKIHFIHFNHTNPVLDTGSNAYRHVVGKGFHIARYLDGYSL